jgi:hypothetical protein
MPELPDITHRSSLDCWFDQLNLPIVHKGGLSQY